MGFRRILGGNSCEPIHDGSTRFFSIERLSSRLQAFTSACPVPMVCVEVEGRAAALLELVPSG